MPIFNAIRDFPKEGTGARAVGLRICRKHDYLTEAAYCKCASPAIEVKWAVAGSDYGYIHTTAGSIRFWGSYSGAARFAKQYRDARV